MMPACWYVLMRYWLRVDGVLIRCAAGPLLVPTPARPDVVNHLTGARLRETRVFCATTDAVARAGGASVLRERSFRDETFDGMRARCATLSRHPLKQLSEKLRVCRHPCRGAPCTLAQFPDGETASQVLLAAGGPVTVSYDRLDCTPLVRRSPVG